MANNNKIKVLIVDDNDSLRYSMNRVFSTKFKDKYELRTAENGKKCIEMINADKPDIVLLDLMMPEMNGWETYDNIISNDKIKDIPVIFMTALNEENQNIIKPFEKIVKSTKDIEKIVHVKIKNGNYIQKPFDINQLIEIINKFVKNK